MPRRDVHCHKMIAETAEAMAHELYDTLMGDNQWYADWKKAHPNMAGNPKALEALFIKNNIGKLVPQARATLAGMLSGPIDSALKEQIYEALLADNTLTRGRGVKYVMPTGIQ